MTAACEWDVNGGFAAIFRAGSTTPRPPATRRSRRRRLLVVMQSLVADLVVDLDVAVLVADDDGRLGDSDLSLRVQLLEAAEGL